jgi:hypothetical protein
VKPPRFRIAWIMVAVAIAAFDFMVIRRLVDYRTPTGDFLLLGALPMANVLAIGMLVGQRRPGSRPFLLGFVAFGAMALAVFVAGAIFFTDELVMPYLALVLRPMVTIIGQRPPVVLIPIWFSCAVFMLGLPQLAFALLGGFLSHKLRPGWRINGAE